MPDDLVVLGSNSKGVDMKIRSLIALLVVAGLAVGGWYIYSRSNEDPGFALGMAIGNARNGEAEMHLVVELGMVRVEGLKPHPAGGFETWDEWVIDHFKLRDSSGKDVQLRKTGWSDVIGQAPASNPEFYLVGKVKVGGIYTLTYIPRREGLVKHTHSFTITEAGQKFQRVFFKTE